MRRSLSVCGGRGAWSTACVLGAAMALAGAAGAQAAQFIPTIPPKPAPTPEYVPPAPPPPPPAAAPEPRPVADQPQPAAPTPAVPPISLVEKNAAGKVRDLPGQVELEAIRRVSMEPDRRPRVDAVLLERGEEFERLVAANPATALDMGESVAKIDETQDLGMLVNIREKGQGILLRSTPSEDLMRRGVILSLHKSVIDKAIEEYDTLRRDAWQQENPDNVMAVVVLIAKDKTRQLSFEPLAAMDRLLDKVAQDPARFSKAEGLSDKARGLLKDYYPNVPALERRKFLRALDDSDRKAMLAAVAPAKKEAETSK